MEKGCTCEPGKRLCFVGRKLYDEAKLAQRAMEKDCTDVAFKRWAVKAAAYNRHMGNHIPRLVVLA